jgi:hypothetical protein
MIIFNLGAIIQAIIVGLIGFLLYKIGLWDLINRFDLSMNNKNIIVFYGAFFLLAFTHLAGAKGKLFFIPTWILCLALIFIHNFGNGSRYEIVDNWFNSTFTYINYVLPFILFIITFVMMKATPDETQEVKEIQDNNTIQQ